MNIKALAKITVITALCLCSPCRADDLDDLLKQLEDAERKPAAKKAPIQQTEKTSRIEQETDVATPIKPSTTSQRPLAYTPPQPPRAGDQREQRIVDFFQTKISPIAESMYKLVESDETQKLVETAKKKRLEREKAVAAKIGKGPGARPRYTTVGGQSGRGGYGGPSKGFDHGSSGWGKGGWNPPTQAPSNTTPTNKTEPDKNLGLSTPESHSNKNKEPYYGSTKMKKEKDHDFAIEKQQIINKSKQIQKTLTSWIDQLNRAPDKQPIFQKMADTHVIDKLNEMFTSRANKLTDDCKLPEDEIKKINEEILRDEKGLWKQLFKHDTNYAHYLKAQIIKDNLNPLISRLTQENMDDLPLNRSETNSESSGSATTESNADMSKTDDKTSKATKSKTQYGETLSSTEIKKRTNTRHRNFTASEHTEIQKLQQDIASLAGARPSPEQLLVAGRLLNQNKSLSTPTAEPIAESALKAELEAIKPDFTEEAYKKLRPTVEIFFNLSN